MAPKTSRAKRASSSGALDAAPADGAPADAADAAYPPLDEAKSLICDLCAAFYAQGWVGGTGGGLSMKAKGGVIAMAPSGVQKERMRPDDLFVLDAAGGVLQAPAPKPPPARPPKLSECAPLFMAVSG